MGVSSRMTLQILSDIVGVINHITPLTRSSPPETPHSPVLEPVDLPGHPVHDHHVYAAGDHHDHPDQGHCDQPKTISEESEFVPERPVPAFVVDTFDQDMDVVIEQNIVLTIGDQQHTLPKGTPIKLRQIIDDHVKLDLLDKYIEFAEDPLARDQPGSNARSKARNQLKPIWENHHIKLKNGKYMRIEDLNLDNLSTIFAQRGFVFQGNKGLYWLVDSYFEHIEEEPNKERIRELREEFITWVKAKLGN